jgi:Icc-related predicted phosphoesterase
MQQDQTVRIAAAGDIHCRPAIRREIAAAFAEVDGRVDLILLAGDLTTHGEPEQAAVLAAACGQLETPVLAVLGNHDWHAGRHDELVAVLTEAGVRVLDRDHEILDVRGCEVGVVGAKGFVGGFPGSHLSDFGEPLLRQVYAETGAEVRALEQGLRAISMCPFRIVLLHYAPSEETLEGEPHGIWTYLGSDRLAAPIREHEPDLVLHGHAHAGTFAGYIGGVPVHNVSVPVMGESFWVYELQAAGRPTAPIH